MGLKIKLEDLLGSILQSWGWLYSIASGILSELSLITDNPKMLGSPAASNLHFHQWPVLGSLGGFCSPLPHLLTPLSPVLSYGARHHLQCMTVSCLQNQYNFGYYALCDLAKSTRYSFVLLWTTAPLWLPWVNPSQKTWLQWDLSFPNNSWFWSSIWPVLIVSAKQRFHFNYSYLLLIESLLPYKTLQDLLLLSALFSTYFFPKFLQKSPLGSENSMAFLAQCPSTILSQNTWSSLSQQYSRFQLLW